MPVPRIFVSSTCYDLKYIRENLKFFIRNLGYDPVLSEEGSVFYDPTLHVQDACLAEVPSCQLLILIIGGRYGVKYRETNKSITNAEYAEAIHHKIPVFALVERGVYDQYFVYLSNRNNPNLDATRINYPSVDSTKIFDFVTEVQEQAINNALVPFSDFEDIQNYLRQQWASMLHRFLTSESEARRVADILSELAKANEKIEFLTRQIVNSVGDQTARLSVELYDYLLGQEVARELEGWKIHVTPQKIIRHKTLDEICQNKIVVDSEDDSEWTFTYGGPPYTAGSRTIEKMRQQYIEARGYLLKNMEDKMIEVETFLRDDNEEPKPNNSLKKDAAESRRAP